MVADKPDKDVRTFAMLYGDFLKSDAYRTLPLPATRLLGAFANQHNGHTNGSLVVTFADAKDYGVSSKRDYVDSLKELMARGILVKTRQGSGGSTRTPNLFALTLHAINE